MISDIKERHPMFAGMGNPAFGTLRTYFNVLKNERPPCGLVVRVPGYRCRDLGSIPDTNGFS
jgi:hypothetical protein